LLFLYEPSIELLICGDFNIDYLLNDNHKQQLSVLLNTFNMVHTVNFPNKLQNNHASAIDNISVDKLRLSSCVTVPLCNALSDHQTQCLILHKFFATSSKIINRPRFRHKSRLFTSETINYFMEQLSHENWKEVYLNSDVNGAFNNFLCIFLNIYEASFPVVYLSNNNYKSWITTGIKTSCRHKRFVYKLIVHTNDPKVKTCYKKYCLILRKVIYEAKKLYYNQLIETSNNRNKTVWNIIRNLSHKSSRDICMPDMFKLNNRNIQCNDVPDVFNKYFLNVANSLLTLTN
jgi:hypothetical protein